MKRILKVTGDRRTPFLNGVMGIISAFVAGGVNAGGFLVVGQYTSHLTGIIAGASDALGLGIFFVAKWAAVFVSVFTVGAIVSAVLIQVAQGLKLHSRYALAFLVSGGVLVVLGVASQGLMRLTPDGLLLKLALFFSMGMQNATVSRMSDFVIRATHMTGIVTDIGIEIGTWLSGVKISASKLAVRGGILIAFFVGGVIGAVGMGSPWGIHTLSVLGGILILLSLFPVVHDLRVRHRYAVRQRHRQAGI
ncbi:MAG: YoaK family protein [Candidatus Margulisiibacteriota bacterium]